MVDFTKLIKNSNKFRQPALRFLEVGSYCLYPEETTEYFQYWDTEKDRCLNGYTADDGDFISGYNYFYLNYCPISRIVNHITKDALGNTVVKRINEVSFPDFWDYDYYYFLAVENALELGKHLCLLKSRRKGYSFKGGAMACRNYYLIPNSKTFIYASSKQYLTDDGILTKAWDYMDFIDKNTAWGKKRIVNTQMRRRAGFTVKDSYGNVNEVGYKSEIIGVTLKDNPDIVRGKKANLILFEEGGSFSELGAAWQIARPSVEIDGLAFGTMIVWGCVCAGTKIWTADGNCVNVEDLNPLDGIIGWDTYLAYPLNISHVNPPAEKECLRITTNTGRTLECSKDHPLLWSTPSKTKRVPGKRAENEHMKAWLWHRAELCKVGEQVGVIDQIPFFGSNSMWEPRFIGWLIGDGSYGPNKTPVLSNCDATINNYVIDNFDYVIEKEYKTKTGKLYLETRIKGIVHRLRELGIYGQTKSAKRLPINIHTYDKDTLSELIGGIFDTDGYVSLAKDGRVRISLTQCQKEILDEISDVLLHFGVHCTIRHIKSRNRTRLVGGKTILDKDGEWRLEINDITSVSKFAENIVLSVGYKQAALDLIWLFAEEHLAKHNKYVNGVHAERIVKIEDIGMKPIYNLTAKEQNNYIANGIITHNTGGDEGSAFATMKDMFYNPDGYNCIGFENIWDEIPSDKKCGFFVPQYTNLDIRDNDGNRMYMDEDGNTYHKKSLEKILEERKIVITNATNTAAIDRYVAERPVTPQEAMLEFNGNIFPKKELQEQLARIRVNTHLSNAKQVGNLTWEQDGTIKWTIKLHGDITRYPLLKEDDPTGSIVIWEHPVKDAPVGLYIVGVDPYDHDQSGTNSLGSTFVYKRFLAFELNYDVIVAEYTGRPATAEEYYENLRKIAVYYNGRIMYENERKGLFPYFTTKHCDYLLADQPDILTDVIGNTKVQRKKGCHMNKLIKDWGEGLIKDWLNDEKEPGKKNLYYIYSEPLLEELISYNDSGNFDRCLKKGTLITTDNGDTPIEEIKVGDKILTHRGNYKPVTWTDSHTHNGKLVTLQYSGDYLKLECTDNHPIFVRYTNNKKHKFRKLDNLIEDFLRADLLNYKYQFALLPKRNIINKPRTVNNRLLYLLGWIMGDGYCNPKSNEVKITYQLNQLDCAELCKQIIEEFDNSVPCKLTKDKFANCYRLTIYSKKLHNLATGFGCIPNNKEISKEVYNNHTDLIPFILGLLEADGHLNYNVKYDSSTRNSIEISTIYEALLRLCRLILIDNGIYSTIREIKNRNGKRQVSLLINGEYVHKLLDFYSDGYDYDVCPIRSFKFKQIPFKKSRQIVQQNKQGFWVPIRLLNVKEINEDVYNIEVKDDHTYVANGIVTHNCMALMQVMIYKEQLYNLKVKENKAENKNRVLFDGPIFTQDWFRDDVPNIFSADSETYMF